MTSENYLNPKKSLLLHELDEKFDFLINLYNKKKFPKVFMLSGKKGIGKSTLISHFLNYVYNKENYNIKKKIIEKNSPFHIQYVDNSFSNVIYLSGDNYTKIKIDDIRDLRSQLLKTTIINKERFIILDDVELFNSNSLNALLKVIEEPTDNNFFILINNETKNLIETIQSRSLEYKVLLTNQKRKNIIDALIKENDINSLIDYHNINITPGNFLSFNNIMTINKIHIEDQFLINIEKIISIYKKEKSMNLINLALLFTDLYFFNIKNTKKHNIDKITQNKDFVINNINKFVVYNLNQNSLINALNIKLSNE